MHPPPLGTRDLPPCCAWDKKVEVTPDAGQRLRLSQYLVTIERLLSSFGSEVKGCGLIQQTDWWPKLIKLSAFLVFQQLHRSEKESISHAILHKLMSQLLTQRADRMIQTKKQVLDSVSLSMLDVPQRTQV